MLKLKTYNLLLLTVFLLSFAIISCAKEQKAAEETSVSYYTCGMHPSVHVSPKEYEQGKKNCPICNMNLTPVYKEVSEEAVYYGCGMEGGEHVFQMKDMKEGMKCPICGMPLKKLSKNEAEKLKGLAGQIKLKEGETALAGLKLEALRKRHLYKQIRTVGKVAYDPKLAIAQEEFLSSLMAYEKIKEGSIIEIKERAMALVESSKRKLRLLGLSDIQIKDLEKTREVETSLILPEKTMWIYADVYEYELSWIKPGNEVMVSTSSIPGEKFHGRVASINPVIDPKTRSATFRAQVENPDLKLMPEMYVDVSIESMYMAPDGAHEVLAVPKEAVLDTGMRKVVWTYKGSGEYEGIEVEIGPEAVSLVDGKEKTFYPVLKGLREGDNVVTKANFLIDSQSQISGTAASAYGGAIGTESDPELTGQIPGHQH